MNEAAAKQVLRMFSYGLFAITTQDDGKGHGMLANWIMQVSFEPRMVAVAIENDSKTRTLIDANGVFAVNVLESGQRELAGNLGRRSAKTPQKNELYAFQPGSATGTPLLADALGWLDCRVVGSLPSGDHTLYVAEVVEAGVNREGTPLSMAEAGFRYYG